MQSQTSVSVFPKHACWSVGCSHVGPRASRSKRQGSGERSERHYRQQDGERNEHLAGRRSEREQGMKSKAVPALVPATRREDANMANVASVCAQSGVIIELLPSSRSAV